VWTLQEGGDTHRRSFGNPKEGETMTDITHWGLFIAWLIMFGAWLFEYIAFYKFRKEAKP